jgi:hypothetical protein
MTDRCCREVTDPGCQGADLDYIAPRRDPRRDGRVAEGARLESVYTGNRIVGSNPTPSASARNALILRSLGTGQ